MLQGVWPYGPVSNASTFHGNLGVGDAVTFCRHAAANHDLGLQMLSKYTHGPAERHEQDQRVDGTRQGRFASQQRGLPVLVLHELLLHV